MRAGTTSLHYNLSRHPEILMSKKKETDFFSEPEQWKKGALWYLSQFRKTRCKSIGESSPGYTRRNMFPEAPARMHAFLPDIQLIYLTRAPLDRAISQFVHGLLTSSYEATPEKALAVGGDLYYQSCYGYQIEPYLELYKKENILALRAEELWAKPYPMMKKIFKFLDVDPSFRHPDFDLPLNQSIELPPSGFFKPRAWKTFQNIIDRDYFLNKSDSRELLKIFQNENKSFAKTFKVSEEGWYNYSDFRKREKAYLKSLRYLTNSFFGS